MEELFLSGSQIATYATLTGSGNGTDRTVTLTDVQAIGSSTDIYRIVVNQTNGNNQFSNGQQITIYDPDGNVVMASTTVQPDAEQGAAAGDEYLIFTQGQQFVFDLNGFPPGSSTQVYSNDAAGQQGDTATGDNDGDLDFADVAPMAICFTPGTLIDTRNGPRPVQDLRPGTTVRLIDGTDAPILWSGSRRISLLGTDAPRPILIAAGALGRGCPSHDLIVSPQHRLCLSGPRVQADFGEDAVLAPARGLTSMPGVREMRGKREVTYVSVLLAHHGVMLAHGAATESLYPGPQALRALTPVQRKLVYRAVPGLAANGPDAYGPPAHRLLSVREARDLAHRLATDARRVAPVAATQNA